MIEANVMHGWSGFVESIALIAVVVLGIGVMVSAMKPSDLFRHFGTILFLAFLLLMLPSIMVSAWSSMSFWQQLGVVILGVMIGLALRALRLKPKKR